MKTKMMMLAAVAMLAGCAAETGSGEEGDASEEVGTTSEALSVTTYRWALPYHGGTGGAAGSVSCASGDVAVGLWGSYGSYVNELGLICAHLNTNGTFGTRYTTAARGTPGPKSFFASCPSTQMLIGLGGKAATYLDSIYGRCGAPNGERGLTPFYGGYGGNLFLDECPDDYAVTGLTVRSANWVDGMRGTCSYIKP